MSSKMTKCKACEKDIAKGVKKCPNCGKDQRNFFMRHKIISFVLALVVLGGIGGALGGGDDSTPVASKADASTTNDGGEEKEKEQEVYETGDVVNLGDVEMTLVGAEQLDEVGNEYMSKEASDGGTFVAIQYTMKNVSDEPIGAFSTPTVNLVDENGTSYDSDIDASSNYAVQTDIDNSKIMSDLNPDISVTGVDVYEISKEKFESGSWFVKFNDKHVQIK